MDAEKPQIKPVVQQVVLSKVSVIRVASSAAKDAETLLIQARP
jgi:hypothetical protein